MVLSIFVVVLAIAIMTLTNVVTFPSAAIAVLADDAANLLAVVTILSRDPFHFLLRAKLLSSLEVFVWHLHQQKQYLKPLFPIV